VVGRHQSVQVVAQDSWLISEFGHHTKDHYNGRKKFFKIKNYKKTTCGQWWVKKDFLIWHCYR
jgi:hypothetical protein